MKMTTNFKNLLPVLALAVVSSMGSASTSIAQESGSGREDFRAAIESCMSEVGASGRPEEWSDSVRSNVDSCLAAKGIEKPPRPPEGEGRGAGGRRGPPPNFEKMKACLAEQGIALPEPQSGRRPEIDEATRKAMDACREQVGS